MKRFLYYMTMVLAVLTLWVMPTQEAKAENAPKPIAYVVMDHTGAVDGAMYKDFRSVVKLAYYYPHYELLDGGKAQELVAQLINSKQKLDAKNLAWVAEQANLEGVVVARILEMEERRVATFRFRNDDNLFSVSACADLAVYRKTGNKFLAKKLRQREVKSWGEFDHPDYTIKWALSRLVNTLEGREII